MKNLLYKEFRLALHPTSLLFLGLSAMLLIPNYPYYVIFFYTGLGVFFTCLTGRENHDIEYSMLLPVRKRDIVRARAWMIVLIELAQGIAAIPFMVLRGRLIAQGNAVGMDANIALLGLSYVMLGLFNYVFLTSYYKNPEAVGKSFARASTVVFFYIALAEAADHAVPFMRDCLDTRDPLFLGYKLAVLAGGLTIFALLNWLAARKAIRTFETLDL